MDLVDILILCIFCLDLGRITPHTETTFQEQHYVFLVEEKLNDIEYSNVIMLLTLSKSPLRARVL